MNIIPNGNVYRVAFPASVHAPNSLKYSCCLQPESLCTLLHSTSKALQDSERKTLRHPMHLWREHSVLWFIARTQQKQNTNQNENDRNQEPCSRKKKFTAIKSRADSYTHTGCSYSTPQPEDDTNRRAPRTIFIYPPHSVAINSLMSAWRVRLAACAKIIAILAFDR